MLRPERMSKVSVTGAKAIMPTVIETVHDLHLVHLSDYDGSWEGFDNGDPIEGAEEAAEKLVTVRALESILGVDPETETPESSITEGFEERLEEIRTEVNELDDRRTELREKLREVTDRIDTMEPFHALGIDLDLLWGYDWLEIAVGEGDRETIEAALEDADEIHEFETFAGDGVFAIAAVPTDRDETGAITDALIGIEFQQLSVPEVDGSPEEYLEELTDRREELERSMADIDEQLASIREREAGFILAVEEQLTIEVDRTEAPLRFATTERSFVAEGWVPTAEVETLRQTLASAVGERIEFEELEQADYEEVHHDEHEEDDEVAVEDESAGEPEEEVPAEPPRAATDGGATAAAGGAGTAGMAGGTDADGDDAVTMDREPPVVLDNLRPARPFELMVKMVNQPKYSELDPTILVFLTFPFAFGFMIGDIGYGILYMAMGLGLWRIFDSEAGKAIGSIAIWAGVFTVIFGYLYDDIFGVHMADLGLGWLPLAGTLTKGLQTTEWAIFWIVASLLFGIVHLNMGLVLGFVNELRHGVKAAVFERLSWILAMNGLFLWIFSLHLVEYKPDFLVGTESVLYAMETGPSFGFVGVPETVGIAGLGAFALGFLMVGKGEGIAGLAETPAWAFGHVLSYLRMVAVLLAKGGMAFVVNVLVFGAYAVNDSIYFGLFASPATEVADDAVVFDGLVWIGLESGSIAIAAIGVLAAIVVFVLGHILVLLLGITAAGIQMLRLEYVEFFQKFYEGGGEEYEPFGTEHSPASD